MGQLADRMVEEMEIRGLCENTREAYLCAMRSLVKFCGCSPGKIQQEDVRRYQLYVLRERKLSASTLNQHVSAIRFFFHRVLPRPWALEEVPHYKGGQLLPEVLSRQEVLALLGALSNLKHRTILATVYSAGLRLNEARHLQVEDIDSDRMSLRIRQGKGRKDRNVKLPRKLLDLLREYWLHGRPRTWLFPGEKPQEPLCESSFQRIFHQARVKAGIKKGASLHSLRHSYATHLLESGVNLVVLQRLLGHKSLQTTARYLHLSQADLEKVPSLLDDLGDAVTPELLP